MIQLKIDDNFVDIDNTDAISLTLNIKNIKNYGKRNVSFSKPMKVLKTPNSERVFKNLSNINTVNGYTISDMVDGELQENGVTILKGTIKVEDFDNYYNITISSGGFNLFNEMGDKLIVDNLDASDNITFDASSYFHTYTRDFVRTQLRSDPSDNGHGYMYPIIDYENNLDEPEDLTPDYILLPAIAARELFDGIFDKYDYTYELSDDISTYINKLYIPFNDDVQKYTADWKYFYSRLGAPTCLRDTCTNNPEVNKTGLLSLDGDDSSAGGDTGVLLNANNIKGILIGSDYWYDRVYDIINTEFTYGGYTVPYTGKYNLTTNIVFSLAYNQEPGQEWLPQTDLPNDMDVNLYINRNNNLISTTKLGTAEGDVTEGNPEKFYNYSTLDLQRNDIIYIGASNSDSEADEFYTRMAVRWDPSTNFKLTYEDSFLGNNNSFELNDLRPKNLKQSEFLNDIFKLFNCFVETDPNDNKKLIIKSYNYYFTDSASKDWTEKLDQVAPKTSSLKNEFAKQTVFTYTEDEDIFNKDFKSKYGYPFNYKIIENDSEFITSKNEIKLNIASTIIKTIKST